MEPVEDISVEIIRNVTIILVRTLVNNSWSYYVTINGKNCKPLPMATTRAQGKDWHNTVISLYI